MPPRLLLVFAALLFSTGGAAIKATSLTPWQTAGFRSLAAAVALLILLPEARRGWSRRIVPIAVAYASCLVLFVLSTKMTTAANAIFLQSTAPAWLLFLSPWLLKEAIGRAEWLHTAALAAGMALFFLGSHAPMATAPEPLQGNILATASGLSWALTIVGLRWLSRKQEAPAGLAMVVLGNLFAFVVCVPMAFPVVHATSMDWGVILYLGVFQIGLAYVCLTRGMRDVPAFEAATILLLEPVTNPVWAFLLHGERPAHLAIAGAAVILASTLLKAYFSRQRQAPA
jgi:DME family drug/metabolite transporter